MKRSEALELPESAAGMVAAIREEGTAENTRKAYAGDLAYFRAWAEVALGQELSFPVSVATVLLLVTDHLGAMKPEADAELVRRGVRAKPGPHSLNTIRRRLAVLGREHERIIAKLSPDKRRDARNPVRDFEVRELLKATARALVKKGIRPRKKKAATAEVLQAMLDTCGDRLIDRRDRALLLFAAASGGRRRSEVCSVQVEDLEPVAGGFVYRLQRSKTDQEGEGKTKPVLGKAAAALGQWLRAAEIQSGPIFRRINRHGQLLSKAISPAAVGLIVKRRAELAGFDPADFGGHSLRSGFVTEGGRQGVSRGDVFALSDHSPSSSVGDGYYQAGSVLTNPAALIFG
jgi:integrase